MRQKKIDKILDYKQKNGSCMSCDYVEAEIQHKQRVVYEDKHVIALVPYSARYAYDVLIYPKRHISFLYQSTRIELDSFAKVLPMMKCW